MGSCLCCVVLYDVYYALLLSSFTVYLQPFFCIIQNNLYFSIKENLNVFTGVYFIAFFCPSSSEDNAAASDTQSAALTKEFLEYLPVTILWFSQKRKEGSN